MSKKLLLFSSLLLFVVIAASFGLVKLKDRPNPYKLSASKKAVIMKETKGFSDTDIINYSLKYTANKLSFAQHNSIDNGVANCVGYARLCASVCNTALSSNKIQGIATPVVGYIKVCDVNLCSLVKSVMPTQDYKNFVKDHDFVELRTSTCVYQFDPCMYDIIGVSCLTATPLH